MTRTRWHELPDELAGRIGDALGSPVVEAISQAGGFSPGGADRLLTSDGSRAFVKTLRKSVNNHSYTIHQQEARVLQALPASVAAPKLLGVIEHSGEDDDWIALILEDIDGASPGHMGDGSDVPAVLEALSALPEAQGTLADLPRLQPDLAHDFASWDRMIHDGLPEQIPAHVAKVADRFRAAAVDGAAAADGDYLVHGDMRADNLLRDGSGDVWIVDWPWAAVGAQWVDSLTYLLDCRVRGEQLDPDQELRTHPVFRTATAREIDAVLAGFAGMFFERAASPRPPGLTGLREFQLTEALAAADWLLRRWEY